ncbi:hypothetical protein FDK38_004236 [Candidozyma auris]|nr:hypothetical protein FDK38_004236 [[Candida] auris]
MQAPSMVSGRRQIDIDRDRITVLLLINVQLLKKAYQMYVSFLSNPQALQSLAPQGRQQVLEQYSNLNRRLQCNLSVLSYINDTYHNKAAAQQPNRLQFPVILSAPAELPELRQLYKRLQDLYPEALQFLKVKLQQMKQQQEMQRPGMVQHPSQQQQSQMQQLSQQPQQHPQRPMPSANLSQQSQAPQSQQQPQQQQLPQHQSPYDQFAMRSNTEVPQANRAGSGAKPSSQQRQKAMDMAQSKSFMGPPKDDFVTFNNNNNSNHMNTNGNDGVFPGSYANDNNDGMPMNMSSISPQQILQQQQNGGGDGGNDFMMDFY